jgi:hypothetical protein
MQVNYLLTEKPAVVMNDYECMRKPKARLFPALENVGAVSENPIPPGSRGEQLPSST